MIRHAVFALFCILISIIDSKTRRIPDLILLVGFIVATGMNYGRPLSFLTERLSAAVFAFLTFLTVFTVSGGLGFGDVKFAALLGYWLGFRATLVLLFCTALFCVPVYFWGTVCRRWDKTVKLPFAPFLCAAALLAAEVSP
jgi:prepilin signal peptidase PulO-like enzyme (type II secretory pathway)